MTTAVLDITTEEDLNSSLRLRNDQVRPLSNPKVLKLTGAVDTMWKDDSFLDAITERPYRLYHKVLVEFVGTFIFVFVGTMSLTSWATPTLTDVALAHGLTIFVVVSAFGHVSGGHFNPAVSLGVALSGKLSPISLPFYIVAQLIGGTAASFVTYVCTTDRNFNCAFGGATLLAPGVTWYQGLIVEFILSYILVQTVLLTAVDTSEFHLAPFSIGMVLALDNYAGGKITGASMNPARSLGPNIAMTAYGTEGLCSDWNNNTLWNYHWVYWAGPFAAAAVAALLFRFILGRDNNRLV